MLHVAAPEENQARLDFRFVGDECHIRLHRLTRPVQIPCRSFWQVINSAYLCRTRTDNIKTLYLLFTYFYDISVILSEGVLFLFPSIAALIMARIEHRKYGDYGLPARGAFGKRFWVGALAGFVAISACLLAIFLLHGFRLTGLAIHGKTIATATLAWSAAFILVGLAEEFSFRGYLQYTLTAGIGFWPSAIILSCLFGVAHWGNPGETKPGLLSVVCFALLFCFILRRTGNLWWAVGFHAGWDWGQTFFYGVPDSGLLPYHNLFNCTFSGKSWLTGGSVGPEASVFTPIVLAVVALIVSSVYRENRYRAD